MAIQHPATSPRMLSASPLEWQWQSFDEFSSNELYAILALRQMVFVVEQHCPYLDCDGEDRRAHHLTGWLGQGEQRRPLAYLRVLPPKRESDPARIGRLLTHPDIRSQGIGRELLQRAIKWIDTTLPGKAIAISAQHYLLEFYRGYGFEPVSAIYLEDGIPHLAMVLEPSA